MNQQPTSGIHFTSYLDPLTAPADVHDVRSQPISAQEITSTIMLSLLVGVGDIFLIWLANTGTLPPFLALLVHVVAVVGLLIFNRVKGIALDNRFSSIALMTMLFTGPVGALGSIIMVVSNLIYRADALTFREWFGFIYPRPVSSLGEALYDGIALHSDEHARRYDVVPFMDIMRLGTAEQKREAINQMVLHFHPRFASVFQMALKDPVLSVRTLAATSMARLEKHLQSQDRKLKMTLDSGEQSPELLLAAAQFYDDYAFSGILDNERKQRYVKLAYDFYQRYLRRRSGDSRASVWIGRLLIRSGQNERAADWFKQIIDEGRSDAHILGWYAEVLYNIGDYDMLRRFMRDYAVKLQGLLHEERYSPLASSIQLWLNRSMEGRA
jgi:hypothetical protein